MLFSYFLGINLIINDFPCGSNSKESACNAGDLGSIPGSGRSTGEGHGSISSILAWRIPWTEESGGLQSVSSQRIGHGWVTNTFAFILLTLEPEGREGRHGPAPRWWSLLSTTASPVSSSVRAVILVIAPRRRRSQSRLQGNRDQSPGDAAPRSQDAGRGEIRGPGTAGGNVHGAAEENRLMDPEIETLNHHVMLFHS